MGLFTTETRRTSPRPRPVTLTGGGVPARPLPYTAVRTLTAAARTVNLQSADEIAKLAKRRGGDAWQSEAWEYYDAIGEVKYALNVVANILSRVRLYAAEVEDPSQPPAQADPDSPGGAAAIQALKRLDSAYGGQPGLMRDAGLNLAVAGECYLVQVPPGTYPHETPESWDVRSVDELSVTTNGVATLQTRRDGDASSKQKLPKGAFIARIWRPHPRFSDEADSSMRGILDNCAELLLLNKTFRATAKSRLNAGMLYLPDGLGVAATADPDLDEDATTDPADPAFATADTTETDDFEEALLDAMTTPISDEESAAAVVPLLVRGPEQLADKIKLIKFERSFDPALVVRADRVLERIMQGIDVPKDVVTGLANVKYANAVQIDESLYRAHIEPLALLLCDALTVIYLRPALRAAGIAPSELHRYVIWYDPSEVTTRPNRSEDANSGYEKTVLSGAAWRRAHGFTDEDAPDPTEIAVRMLVDRGPITPELAEALLNVIAPDVMSQVRAHSQASNPAPLPPDVAQALGGGPAPGTPSPDPAVRAQQQAGGGLPPPVPAAQTLNPEDLV
jgi:hypothetical protein